MLARLLAQVCALLDVRGADAAWFRAKFAAAETPADKLNSMLIARPMSMTPPMTRR